MRDPAVRQATRIAALGAVALAFLRAPRPVLPVHDREVADLGGERGTRRGALMLSGLIVVAGLGYAGALWGNNLRLDRQQREAAIAATGGNPDAAVPLLINYGCGGCHAINGVPGATGMVGPELNNVARRVYIGGVINNSPENLINWIVDPHTIDPLSAMPRTGITPEEARNVAAYLYSMR